MAGGGVGGMPGGLPLNAGQGQPVMGWGANNGATQRAVTEGMLANPNPSNPVSAMAPGAMRAPQGSPQQQGGQQGGDIFSQSAGAYGGALAGTAAGMGYQPQQIRPNYINPAFAGSSGYNSSTAAAHGYNPAQASAQGYAATGPQALGGYQAATGNLDQLGPVSFSRARGGKASADWLRDADLDPYLNPYIGNVVDNTLDDVERQRQIQQTYNAGRAAKAGAFGGSRHGIVESETNRGFADTAADTSAGLRHQGFQSAQSAAMGDIAQQAAISDANAARATQASIANTNASLAASQSEAANRLGLMGQNLGHQNNAMQFGANARNMGLLDYAMRADTAGQFGAQAQNTNSMYNAGAQNQAGQFYAGAQNTIGLDNAGRADAAGAFGAQAGNTARLTNAAAANAARMANQGTDLAAQTSNQGAGLAGAGLRMGAANQMGNLGQMGFNMGRQINSDMFSQGLTQQLVNQQLIDGGKEQYRGFTGAPERALQLPLQALGAAPVPQAQQSSYKPGLFDYLTGAAGIAGSVVPLF